MARRRTLSWRVARASTPLRQELQLALLAVLATTVLLTLRLLCNCSFFCRVLPKDTLLTLKPAEVLKGSCTTPDLALSLPHPRRRGLLL